MLGPAGPQSAATHCIVEVGGAVGNAAVVGATPRRGPTPPTAIGRIRHRGDLTEETRPEDLAAEIQHIDGQAECIIIFVAAPPCQDFSRVGDRDGHAGNRGYLFNFTAEFLDELRRRLAPRRFGFLVENVEMTPADAAEASKQLGCQPVFADAADFGWIGRPRLWWSSVDWDEVTHDPSTAERWTWVLHRRWDRLRLDSPRAAPDSFDLDGLKFSDAVASGRIRLPCSTTPAADERGRPPPRPMRGRRSSRGGSRTAARLRL